MLYDAVIVGGGPAGLAAGIVLAGHGFETLICERRSLPTDKACGEGIPPPGVFALERLGVLEHLTPGAARPFTGVRYISPNGATAEARFDMGRSGLGIRRLALSSALHRRARELPHLRIVEGISARPEGRSGPYVLVDAGGVQIATRLVVGADGLHSCVRRWSRLDGRPARRRRWGARQHYRLRPWTDCVEVHWRPGVEAYVTPVAEEEVGVAVLWEPSRIPAVPGGDRLVPTLLSPFDALGRRLGAAPATTARRATGPLHQIARRRTAEGLLLLGDAAGYVDALTGEGISLALLQARALEETVMPVLRRAKDRDVAVGVRDLAPYERAARSIVRAYEHTTGLLLELQRHPWLVERTIRALSEEPRAFRHLLSSVIGERSPWSLPPVVAMRLLGVLLRGTPATPDSKQQRRSPWNLPERS